MVSCYHMAPFHPPNELANEVLTDAGCDGGGDSGNYSEKLHFVLVQYSSVCRRVHNETAPRG